MMPHAVRLLIVQQRLNLVFALRGTVAVLAAVAVAAFLKLENPYWAGMTALIVIQPTRGLLLEKSFYRLLGSAAGSLAGLLLCLSIRDYSGIALALSLWLAACVGVGNLLYGLRSYASLMAGCTGVVVAMSVCQNPSHLYQIAFGRTACIMVGIIVSTAISFFFVSGHSSHSGAQLSERLRRVAAESVDWLALLLRRCRESQLAAREQDILIELAEIEELVDLVGAGSVSLRDRKRHLRSLILSLLSLLAVGRLSREQIASSQGDGDSCRYWRDLFAWQLEEVACKLESSSPVHCTREMEAVAAEAAVHLPQLGEILGEMVASLQTVVEECHLAGEGGDQLRQRHFIRHRDWQQAGRAATRAGLALAAVGLTWSATGWSKGPLMLMAMSIMLSVFSVKEHPAFFVGQIFAGAAAGSATAALCRIALLAGVTDPFTTIAVIAPFVLFGVFCMSQRRTAIAATDATLFYLFVTQPGMPVAVVPVDVMLGAVAMVMGVGSAWLSYRFLVPINPGIRLNSFMASILREVESVAGGASPAAMEKAAARLRHRVLRLVAMAVRHDSGHRRLVAAGIAALAVTDSVKRLKEALTKGDLSPSQIAVIRDTLLLLSGLSRRHGEVTPVLEKAAAVLYHISEPVSETAQHAASGISATGKSCWSREGLQCPI